MERFVIDHMFNRNKIICLFWKSIICLRTGRRFNSNKRTMKKETTSWLTKNPFSFSFPFPSTIEFITSITPVFSSRSLNGTNQNEHLQRGREVSCMVLSNCGIMKIRGSGCNEESMAAYERFNGSSRPRIILLLSFAVLSELNARSSYWSMKIHFHEFERAPCQPKSNGTEKGSLISSFLNPKNKDHENWRFCSYLLKIVKMNCKASFREV